MGKMHVYLISLYLEEDLWREKLIYIGNPFSRVEVAVLWLPKQTFTRNQTFRLTIKLKENYPLF